MATNVQAQLINAVKKDGLLRTIKQLAVYDLIRSHRIDLSKRLDALFNSTIGYGPFQGLKLTLDAWWGAADRGAMLLGLYEQEVLESLKGIPKKYSTFIDLGAADGYYGIGVLINNLCERSICYEMSDRGRAAIKNNAALNNVSHRVEVRGIANKNFYNDIPSGVLESSILFIDIEGDEFGLVDEATFQAFRGSIIFIELHEWYFNDGQEKLQKLLKDSSATHVTIELTMGSRDLSNFPELKTLHDNDRWLICSEGRRQLMTWLRFDPK